MKNNINYYHSIPESLTAFLFSVNRKASITDAFPPINFRVAPTAGGKVKTILTKAPMIGAFPPMIDAYPSTIGGTLKMIDAFPKIILTKVEMIVGFPIYFVGTPLSNFSVIKSISTIPP